MGFYCDGGCEKTTRVVLVHGYQGNEGVMTIDWCGTSSCVDNVISLIREDLVSVAKYLEDKDSNKVNDGVNVGALDGL